MNTTSPTVSASIETITPERAAALLEANKENRKIRQQAVVRYARDMAAGCWDVNAEAIKFSKDGTLIDGQHRLWACVEAEAPFTTLVVRGLDFEVRESIDGGIKRSFSDVLRWHGEISVAGLASGIEVSMFWDELGQPSRGGLSHTNTERLRWLEANPDIRDAVRLWSFSASPFRIPVSVGSAFLLRARRLDADSVTKFIELLRTGANMGENHPVNRLRNFMLNAASRKRALTQTEYLAILVKAWNAFILGREIRGLSFRPGGERPEPFPEMVGPDGRTYDEIMEASQTEPLGDTPINL